MMTWFKSIVVITVFLIQFVCSTSQSGAQVTMAGPAAGKHHVMNYVIVTPNGPEDSGDFGPKTPGTKTSGIQEALNYASANNHDVYISGGGYGEGSQGSTGYTLSETLRFPWRQNARVDGGEYWLGYNGTSGDAVVIDSQMNCYIKLGLVVSSQSDGAVVRLQPSTLGPDKMSCLVASTLEFNGMVGAGDVWGKPGAVQKGTGLLFDPSKGGINGNKIFIYEINACEKGVVIPGGCANNNIEVTWCHLTTLGMQVGTAEAPGVSGNRITGGFSCGLPGGTGVQIFGQNNYFHLQLEGHDPGQNLIFEPPSRDNYIFAVTLPQGFTNRATRPTNKLVLTTPTGYGIDTPSFPASGKALENRLPYTIEVTFLTSGQVSKRTITDANGKTQTIPAPLTPGQSLILDPGDQISITYEQPPTWIWRALR